MRFFQGDITEAIAERDSLGAAFVVFVEGEDRLSGEYRAALESEDRLPADGFVAARISFPSSEYEDFADIYRTVPVPSVFVIGHGGLPIAIASSDVGGDQLISVVEDALRKHTGHDEPVHILLKLPTGETSVVQFPDTSTLTDVRLYVRNALRVKHPFHMITPYPRKLFTAEEETQTLTRLRLHPTSTILVVSAEKQGWRLWAYHVTVSFASDVIQSVRRIVRQIKTWITRFLTVP